MSHSSEVAPIAEEFESRPEDREGEAISDEDLDMLKEDLGRKGDNPENMKAPDDESIHFRVGENGELVAIHFGEPIKSVGLTPEEAKDLGGSLLNYARKAQRDR